MVVTVTTTKVTVTKPAPLHEGEYNVTVCRFVLPPEFEGLDVTAAFGGVAVPLTDGACTVPSLPCGDVTLGVWASRTVGGEVQLVYSPRPAVVSVAPGSFVRNAETPAVPTLSEYEQYCRMLQDTCSAEIAAAQQTFATQADVNAALAQKADGVTVTAITAGADDAHLPTAKAVRDYCEARYAALSGAIDEAAALVGGGTP